MLLLVLATMLIKNAKSYACLLRRTRAHHNKNPFSRYIYNHDFLNVFDENMQFNLIEEGRNDDTLRFFNRYQNCDNSSLCFHHLNTKNFSRDITRKIFCENENSYFDVRDRTVIFVWLNYSMIHSKTEDYLSPGMTGSRSDSFIMPCDSKSTENRCWF